MLGWNVHAVPFFRQLCLTSLLFLLHSSCALIIHFYHPCDQMAWPVELRARAVQLLWQLGSATRARRALVSEVGRRGTPPARAIIRWSRAFETTGSVQERPHTRRPHQLTPDTLRALRRSIQHNPPPQRSEALRPDRDTRDDGPPGH